MLGVRRVLIPNLTRSGCKTEEPFGLVETVAMSKDRERSLIVSDVVAAHIENHGREAYPNECCGALIGTDNVVQECFSLSNRTEEGPRRRFLVTPQDYRVAERYATNSGNELIGFYHSHPDHSARPSQYDLDHAWPVFAYVIISVEKGEPRAMTSWRLREDRSAFDETCIKRRNE